MKDNLNLNNNMVQSNNKNTKITGIAVNTKKAGIGGNKQNKYKKIMTIRKLW